MVAVRLLISGRVQGVCFRQSTLQQATALGLCGWVRNLPDGRVEALVYGDETRVEELKDWAHEGPVHAQVSSVQAEVISVPDDVLTLHGFEIR